MHRQIADQILEKVKNTYDVIAPHFSKTRLKLWEDFVYFTPYIRESQSVLDVGCGNGRLTELFKSIPVSYTGIDTSKKLLQSAQRLHKDREMGALFYEGDAMDLSFLKKKFDVVFLIAVFHHIPSHEFRAKVMRNIADALKPGGTLIMTNWNLFQMKYLGIVIKYTLLRLIGSKINIDGIGIQDLDYRDVFIPWKMDGVLYNRYVRAFTLQELRDYVESSGLGIKELLYSKNGKKATFFTGVNSVIIAQKND